MLPEYGVNGWSVPLPEFGVNGWFVPLTEYGVKGWSVPLPEYGVNGWSVPGIPLEEGGDEVADVVAISDTRSTRIHKHLGDN